MHEILVLDVAGTPVRWVDHESAATYYASGKVRWELGTDRWVLHGGTSRLHGRRSTLEIAAIIAIDGPRWKFRPGEDRVPLGRTMVFARDRHVCAYCGGRFPPSALEMEHVIPSSRGGRTVWQNVVSACRACNQRKGNRTPEAAGMPLLYVPYVPNRHEAFILANRRILADQMAFLLAGVPRHSRLWVRDDEPVAARAQPGNGTSASPSRKRAPNSSAGRGRENR
ncbi:MAG TPA: HNH endonuclease [Burkholderiaceae bacterium]|nr:HNH endonuclease [Burkholderiaceae bacterium]